MSKKLIVILMLAIILFLVGIMGLERNKYEACEELKKAHDELLKEHLVLISRYEKLKEEVEELRRELEELRVSYTELWYKASTYWKALMLLGNRSIILRLNVSAPYEEGFKYGVIEVKIPLWKYALYKVCDNPKRLGLDPYNDTILHEVVAKVRDWLIHEGIFDEERFANALVSVAQLLPYNESIGAGSDPICTLVDGGVCSDKAGLAVALLRLAGYDATTISYASHVILAVHLSKPPRFAIKLGYSPYHRYPRWVDDPEDAWYIVIRGKRFYLVDSISHDTIGSQLGIKEIIEGNFVVGWPYYGEKPEKIHAPPYREE